MTPKSCRVSTGLTFSELIDSAVHCMAGWALRTFRGRGRQLMLTVLRTLFQPRLDYCSQLWSPRDQYSINLLESTQKHFISQVKDPALKGMSYWEKLSELRVYSLQCRREIYQICCLWKISQGLIKGFDIKWQ